MKTTLIILLLGISISCWSQNTSLGTISLDTCYNLAHQNYPKTKNHDYYQEIYDLKIKNIWYSFLPSMNLSGLFTHQSDLMEVDFSQIPDNPLFDFQSLSDSIENPSKNNYRASLTIKQTLYDGGLSFAKADIEKNNLAINQQRVEVEFKQIKQQLNTVYFLVLIYQETEKQLLVTLDELESNLSLVQSGVKNGVLLPTEEDKMKAEILRLKQNISEMTFNKIAGINILSKLIGKTLTTETILVIPNTTYYGNKEYTSPEMRLADLQIDKIHSGNKLLTAKRLPKMYAFGMYSYGIPNMVLLNNEPGDVYVFGVALNWNIWDWNITQRQREIIAVQEDILLNQKESIKISQDIELSKEEAEINKYMDLISNDMEIIKLQENIRKAASSQLTNGVITSADYIREVNAETEAKIKLEVHKIQLEQAKLNSITIKGE